MFFKTYITQFLFLFMCARFQHSFFYSRKSSLFEIKISRIF